jgi:hypothetical protein
VPGRLPFVPAASRLLLSQLDIVSVHDSRNQPGKALIDFDTTRGIVHLDAAAFAADQARFSERLEMHRESGLGYGPFAEVYEIGASLRTLRGSDVYEDSHAYGVGECVENRFHRNVFERRVEERSHGFHLTFTRHFVQ